MIVLAETKTAKEAIARATALYDIYLKKMKRNFEGSVVYSCSGPKRAFKHEVVVRATPELEKQMQELHEELYGHTEK